MFTNIDKMLGGLAAPFVAKGLLWLTTTLGMPPFGADVQIAVTAVVVAAAVYFIPNTKARLR